jgi:FkbM family methyltransferase
MKIDVSLPHLYSTAGYEFLWEYLQEQRSNASRNYDSERLGFLSYCMSNLLHSKSQIFQDLYVLFKLKSKRNGFFVEFGAAGGVNGSNSYLLEKELAWKGILAEPFPIWHENLAKHRDVIIDHRCVWSQTGAQLEFLGTEHAPEIATLLSFKDQDGHNANRSLSQNIITVTTVSLNDLLDQYSAPQDIDYLSVDTEGSEFEILSHFDFNKYRPRVITVEHNLIQEAREKLFKLLTGKGYVREFEEFSSFDDWYYLPSETLPI